MKPPTIRFERNSQGHSPLALTVLVALSVLVVETLVMIALHVLAPFAPLWVEVVLDAAALVVLVSPSLYVLVFRPLAARIAAQERAEAELRRAQEALAERARASDEALSAVFDVSPAPIVVLTTDGRVKLWNRAAETVFGWTADEIVGRPYPAVPEGREEDFRALLARVASGEQLAGVEVRRRRKNGEPVDLSVWSASLHGLGGEVTGILAIVLDVTGQKRAQEELRQAKRGAEEATRLKSQFLASMSHEIRTPMNGVIGMTGVLLDTKLTPQQRDYAETIRRSSESLLAIINDILDFAKIESGKLTLEATPFDLSCVVEEVAELLAPGAREKNVELVVRLAAEAPRYVVGDAGRIRQVLINLAGNAVKFTSLGHVLIDVSGAPGPDGSGRFHFHVEDTGIGIREEQIAHLFDRFTQADASTTRRHGGTGLGLAISKQLVEAMGGTIGAAPKPEGGSAFFFTLPLPLDPEPPPARPFPADLRGVRALVVDDHEVNRRVVAEQLASWGIRSEPAASGAEALAKLRAAGEQGDPCGIVLLDFLMPEMDGIAVARAIRSDPALRDSIVIMLSSVERRSVQRGQPADVAFDDWLLKPVRQSRLMDALLSAWSARRGDAPAEPAASSGARPRPRGPLVSARVLVVDDSAVNQRVATLQLRRLGCRVDAAGNGIEAVDMVSRFPYDLVLMDCQMPEVDGYEATAQIRRREAPGRHVAIVAMTAHALEGDRDKCLAAGMDDYLSKPIRPTDLEAALRKWAGHGVEHPGPVTGPTPSGSEPRARDAAAQVLARVRAIADDEATVKEVVGLFLDGATESLRDLRASEGAADASALARSAHKLKGSARNVGAEALAGIAERLEQRVSARGLESQAQLLAAADAELARLREAIEESMGRS